MFKNLKEKIKYRLQKHLGVIDIELELSAQILILGNDIKELKKNIEAVRRLVNYHAGIDK